MLTKMAPHAADGSVTDSTINSETAGGTLNTPHGTGAPVTNSGGPLEPERTCWRGFKEDSAAFATCSPAYVVDFPVHGLYQGPARCWGCASHYP